MIKALTCIFMIASTCSYNMDEQFVFVRNTTSDTFRKVFITDTTTVKDIMDKMHCLCKNPHALYINYREGKYTDKTFGPLDNNALIETISSEYNSIYFVRR